MRISGEDPKRFSKGSGTRIFTLLLIVLFFLGVEQVSAVDQKKPQKKITGPVKDTSEPTNTPKAPLKVPSASVEITHFGKQVAPGTMAAGTALEGTERIFVRYGETVTFNWSIKACNAHSVTANLTHAGSVDPGSRQNIGNNCISMRGSHEMRITQGGMYELRVTAIPTGAQSVVTKGLEVVLQGYEMVIEEVILNRDSREVIFYARNTGELGIPAGEIRVYYIICGITRDRSPVLKEDWLNRRDIDISRGQRVEIGRVTLDERAYYYRNMTVSVRVFGEGYGFGNVSRTFPLAWQPREFRIGRADLEILIGSIVGDIRLNNYNASLRTAERIRHEPFIANDSWVEILGQRTTFTPNPIRLRLEIKGAVSERTLGEIRYWAYINNISLGGNRPELILGSGVLGVRLTFDSTVSREIKGFIYEDRELNDEKGPDVEINRLVVEIMLTPSWSTNRISFSRIQVDTSVSSTFAGGWNIIDRLVPQITREVEDTIRNEVRNQITSLLDTSENRRQVEELFDGLLRASSIRHIDSVSVSNEGIRVRYF